MPVSKAKQASNRKWDKENYDQILVKLPKGTKDLIRQTGAESINGYIRAAIYEKLENNGVISEDTNKFFLDIAPELHRNPKNRQFET